MQELIKLAKQCLSIVESSTLKDKEIEMLIKSAKNDLERAGIDTLSNQTDDLIINTIMIYVTAHFGDTDINKRTEYLKRYKMNLRELQFSEKYQIKGDDSNA